MHIVRANPSSEHFHFMFQFWNASLTISIEAEISVYKMEQDIIRMIEARQMRTLSTHLNYVRESFRKEREIMDNRLDELMSIAFGREDEFYQSNLFSFIRRHRVCIVS